MRAGRFSHDFVSVLGYRRSSLPARRQQRNDSRSPARLCPPFAPYFLSPLRKKTKKREKMGKRKKPDIPNLFFFFFSWKRLSPRRVPAAPRSSFAAPSVPGESPPLPDPLLPLPGGGSAEPRCEPCRSPVPSPPFLGVNPPGSLLRAVSRWVPAAPPVRSPPLPSGDPAALRCSPISPGGCRGLPGP